MIPEKALGRYKIVEVTAPPYWKLSGTAFDETLEYSGQIIKVSDYDKPSNLGVTITKRGNAEVLDHHAQRGAGGGLEAHGHFAEVKIDLRDLLSRLGGNGFCRLSPNPWRLYWTGRRS